MKRNIGVALLLGTVVACSGSGDSWSTPTSRSEALSAHRARHVTILHVNDTHSHLDAVGPKDSSLDGVLGGMTKAATVIDRVRKSAPDALLVHAGDLFEGDLFFNLGYGQMPNAELQLMQQLGFDVLTLGNHEFNYGPALLAAQLATVAPPLDVLSANLLAPTEGAETTPPLTGLVKPHTVKTVDGVRIGFFGLTQPYDLLEQPAPYTIVGGDASDPVTPLAAIADSEVQALRNLPTSQGGPVDVVVLLSHLGIDLDRALAQWLPASAGGIDVILGGHDHFEITFEDYVPGETIVVQAGEFYEKVGKLDLVFQKGRIVAASHRLIPVDADVKKEPLVNAAVQELKEEIVAQVREAYAPLLEQGFPADFDVFHTPVAAAGTLLTSTYDPALPRRDTDVGSLAADALKSVLGADLGFVTAGFVSEEIWPGPVVADDLFRCLPYGINPKLYGAEGPDAIVIEPVTTYDVTPAQLFLGVATAIQLGEIPQVSANMRISYDSSNFPSSLEIIIKDGEDEQRVDPTATTPTFTVATNVFIGQVLNVISGGAVTWTAPPQLDQFAALLAYVPQLGVLAPFEARVIDTSVVAP